MHAIKLFYLWLPISFIWSMAKRNFCGLNFRLKTTRNCHIRCHDKCLKTIACPIIMWSGDVHRTNTRVAYFFFRNVAGFYGHSKFGMCEFAGYSRKQFNTNYLYVQSGCVWCMCVCACLKVDLAKKTKAVNA